MDSDYSDSESVSSTFSESMHTTDLYDSLELGKDPIAYKADKNCIICKTKFGKVGVFHAKKHYCKFCYRGVCATCSPQVAVHPVKLSKLRVCNNCCQKAVINKFSENFKLDIDHVLMEQDRVRQEIKKSKAEKIEIETRVEELKTLYEGEMGMELKFIQIKKANFELEKAKADKVKVRDEMMSKQINFKLDLQSFDKSLQNLQAEFQAEKEGLGKLRSEIFEIKNLLVEKQDRNVQITARIQEAREREERMMKLRKDFEKIDRARKDLSEAEVAVLAEEGVRAEVGGEIARLVEENRLKDEEISQAKIKIKQQEENKDSLVSTAPLVFSQENEQRISELKKIQREKQAIIENLKIQLMRSNPKKEDPLDIEHTNLDKARPCVRCISF